MREQTFPSYSDRCGWNALLPARLPRAPARGRIDARYAIVGAGFTGLAAARRLSEIDPSADIVVLEATSVGEGSSARNSGFLAPTDIAAGADPASVAANDARNRYGNEGFAWLTDLIARYGIACDLHQSGRIKAAATARGEAVVREFLAVVKALSIQHVLLDKAALRERIGTDYYRIGLFTEGGHLVQPAALIRGLAEALPPAVQLFENSPVIGLGRQGKWRLDTPQAQIFADTVIMATNAAIKSFGYLRSRLVTIYTYAALTQPLKPAESANLGTMQSWGLLPAHRLGSTVRRVGADRLLVRSLYAYENAIAPAAAREALLARFRRRYPDLGSVDFDFAWGGTTALTMNGAPYWGEVDDRLYASAGCNGAGIVKGTVLGKRLAEHILGSGDAEDVRRVYGTANWIAPEPFRRLGFEVVSAVERRKAGLES